LPADIPEHITIDISDIGLGHAIHVRDLKLEKIRFMHNDDVIIVSVVLPRAVVETVPAAGLPEEEKIEPEVISKGKPTEEEE
jgi:large subunit ribosomal protein L25